MSNESWRLQAEILYALLNPPPLHARYLRTVIWTTVLVIDQVRGYPLQVHRYAEGLHQAENMPLNATVEMVVAWLGIGGWETPINWQVEEVAKPVSPIPPGPVGDVFTGVPVGDAGATLDGAPLDNPVILP